MKKNPLFKKLNGYQKAPKDRFLLLTQHLLTAEEFVVYEVCLAITDWDPGKGHDEIYGRFNATNKHIAEICGWKSDSQVSRIKKKLIDKGFITRDEDQFIAKDFEKYQSKSVLAKKQTLDAKTQIEAANIHEEIAKMQDFRDQNTRTPLSSYKDNSMSFRTNTEYQSLVDSGSFGSMTVEDMKWIDENVKESINVPN